MNTTTPNLTTWQQNALVPSTGGSSRAARVCTAIMAAVSVVAVLMMVIGGIAGHFGVRAGAIALLNAWLLWPLGCLACGVVVLVMRLRA